MSKLRYFGLALALAFGQACSDDAGVAVAYRDAGSAGGGATGSDAGTDAAVPFKATGVIAGLAWGPSFIGVEDDVTNPGDGDVALGVFWDPQQLAIEYADAVCMTIHTRKGAVVGQDVGTVTIRGGSGSPAQALTRNDQGYYYLAGDDGSDAGLTGHANPWQAGDAIRVATADHSAGPATIPTAFTSTSVPQLTAASRSHALELSASGSNGKLIGASLSGGTDRDAYLVICTGEAAKKALTIPTGALAPLPAEIDTLHLKLQAANAADGKGFRLLAAGASAATDFTLTP